MQEKADPVAAFNAGLLQYMGNLVGIAIQFPVSYCPALETKSFFVGEFIRAFA
jgi:hypothetical protein